MKKGFTLVELLAVIVIIGLLSTVAVTSAFGISNGIKKDMFCQKIDLLVTDAQRWGDSHQSELSDTCYRTKTIEELIQAGVVKKESDENNMVNPYTGEEMDGKIGVYRRNNRAYAFYIYSAGDIEAKLDQACDDELPVCTGSSNRDASGKVICIQRPLNACS